MLYDRYYYSILSEKGKEAYRCLYSGITNLQNPIEISNTLFCDDKFEVIIEAISMDNPHIYYIDFSRYEYVKTKCKIKFIFTYWYSPSEISILNVKMQSSINKILKSINGSNELEKERSVHDLLVKNVKYNENAAMHINKFLPRSNTVLGVLFYKTAVCEGIAKTTKMLLNLLDIKCMVVTGVANSLREHGPHAWNLVKIDGRTYHLDVTWDIGLSGLNHISYKYFNLLDEQIYRDHSTKNKYPKAK